MIGMYCMLFALLTLSIVLVTLNNDEATQGVVAVIATLVFVFGFAIGFTRT